jgi:hypothetical protein
MYCPLLNNVRRLRSRLLDIIGDFEFDRLWQNGTQQRRRIESTLAVFEFHEVAAIHSIDARYLINGLSFHSAFWHGLSILSVG